MLGATMLRRGKMLKAGTYRTPESFLNLPGLSLRQKWEKWAQQESRGRLVYFAMTLDAHVSLARKIRVLFSYAEMETPLPAVARLWEAETAVEWQDILLSQSEISVQLPPPLCKIIRNPHLITTVRSTTDVSCAAFIALSGFWALVHEYREMDSILPETDRWNDFVINSRYAELSAALAHLKAELMDLEKPSPKITIIQDLVSLHLNVSLYDIADYLGIGSNQDAHSATSYVQRWNQLPQSRKALWHAGQIFRTARSLEPRALADIHAIALYHAFIVLWVWGLLRRTQETPLHADRSQVALDEEEGPTLSKFFMTSRGLPCLTDTSGRLIPLTDLEAVADHASHVVQSNWSIETSPLTTDEVIRFIKAFLNISQRLSQA